MRISGRRHEVSPYNHPLFKTALPRCRMRKENRRELKKKLRLGCVEMWLGVLIEVGHSFWSMDFCSILPRVVLSTVPLPFDKELQLAAEHFAVQDFFYHIFFFYVHEFG